MLPHLETIMGTKLFCLSQWHPHSFPTLTLSLRERQLLKSFFSHYDLNDTGIGVAKKNLDLKNGAVFKVRLTVVVLLLYGITAVLEGGDQASLDSQT